MVNQMAALVLYLVILPYSCCCFPPLSENGLVIEVDRFDNGHSGPSGLEPTALIPGDVIVHCTVSSDAVFVVVLCCA